jgi:hypothetical protein
MISQVEQARLLSSKTEQALLFQDAYYYALQAKGGFNNFADLTRGACMRLALKAAKKLGVRLPAKKTLEGADLLFQEIQWEAEQRGINACTGEVSK